MTSVTRVNVPDTASWTNLCTVYLLL